MPAPDTDELRAKVRQLFANGFGDAAHALERVAEDHLQSAVARAFEITARTPPPCSRSASFPNISPPRRSRNAWWRSCSTHPTTCSPRPAWLASRRRTSSRTPDLRTTGITTSIPKSGAARHESPLQVSHPRRPADLPFMAHRMRDLLFALAFVAPLATGCVVGTQSRGRPAHASGYRGAPPPQHVPPGQIRRAEVHQRNEARKAERTQGHKHGDHGHGHD